LTEGSSITEASGNEKSYFILITNVGENDYSLRSLLLPSYSNLDLRLDNLVKYEDNYGLHLISHGDDLDVTKKANLGIGKFFTGDYQGALIEFDEILRINSMHSGQLASTQQLAAIMYNKGLCFAQQGNSTGAEHYKNQAHNIDPGYDGGYLTVELNNDTKEEETLEEDVIELATYSNSDATVFAYISIFENLWMRTQI
jgi:tetratricopeptide (TPR) repeat protein